MVEGITLDNRFEWKKRWVIPLRVLENTVRGDTVVHTVLVIKRCCNLRGYRCKGNVCMQCGFGMPIPNGRCLCGNEITYYIDDCMDAIEYALGDTLTEWGARRAMEGHPEPFPLQYVEIGNENWGPEYDRRFDLFIKLLKTDTPNLLLYITRCLSVKELPL